MRKVLSLICLTMGICIFFGSCDNTETYADKVKDERKNIARFITAQNIEILNEFPKKFEENQYFRDPVTGVYIHVIDSGNGKRANADKRAEITVRSSMVVSLPSDTITALGNTGSTGMQPLIFTYGIDATYTNSTSGTLEYYILSPGLVIPLKYVGENAKVKLIVPFSQGSTYQGGSYRALSYSLVEYTKIIN